MKKKKTELQKLKTLTCPKCSSNTFFTLVDVEKKLYRCGVCGEVISFNKAKS